MDVSDGEVKYWSLPHKFLLHDFSSNHILFAVKLEDSDSDIFVTFFLAGLDWLATFLGAIFTSDGDGSLNVMWPWMYGLNVVIKFLDVSIATLKGSGPQESFTSRS